jgi:hypothetical protein
VLYLPGVTPTLLDDKETPDGTIGRQQRHDGQRRLRGAGA